VVAHRRGSDHRRVTSTWLRRAAYPRPPHQPPLPSRLAPRPPHDARRRRLVHQRHPHRLGHGPPARPRPVPDVRRRRPHLRRLRPPRRRTRHPRRPPRLALLGFVAVSGALNWSHGQQIGGPSPGSASRQHQRRRGAALRAAPPRRPRRAARRPRPRRRAPAVHPARRLGDVPGRSWKTLRGAVGARLDTLDPIQQTQAPRPRSAVRWRCSPPPPPHRPTPPTRSPCSTPTPVRHAVRPALRRRHPPDDRHACAPRSSPPGTPPRPRDPRADARRDRAHEPHLADLPPETLPLRKDRTVTTAICLAVCLLLMLGSALGLLAVDRRALPPGPRRPPP
jgi:hypothetical protein